MLILKRPFWVGPPFPPALFLSRRLAAASPPKDDEGDRRPAKDKIGFQYSAGAKSKDQLLALAGLCTVGLKGKNPPEN